MWTEHRLLSFDGTPIFFRVLKSQVDGVSARILILHGIGEYGGRYLEFAEYLAARGAECVVPDLRGFGRSGGARAFAHRASDLHEDLYAVLSFAQKKDPRRPFFYFGHSFGGLVVSSYLAARKVRAQGLILSSPLFGIADPVPTWKHLLGVMTAFCLPRFSQSTSVIPEDLTHDKKIIDLYKKDSLIYQRITAGLYHEMLALMAGRTRIARELVQPTLILQAGDDRVVDKEKTRLFYEELSSSDKKLQIYPGYFHELLNEEGRDGIFKTIFDWLASRIDHNLFKYNKL